MLVSVNTIYAAHEIHETHEIARATLVLAIRMVTYER